MSDYSAEAMKLKERSEICPNCEHPMTKHACEYESSLIHLHCSHCGCSITRERKRPKDMDMLKSPNVSITCGSCGHVYQVVLNCHYAEDDCRYYAHVTRPDARACEHWIPNQDSLEQRYQQLEQVTLWMYDTMRDHCAEAYSDEARERLESLGVSVDEK